MVVCVGVTDTLPEVATLPIELSMLTVVAFVEAQVSVALCPAVMVEALDVRVTVGAGLGGGVVDAPPPQPASSHEISSKRTMCNDALRRRASLIISADQYLIRKCSIASTCCSSQVSLHNG